MSPSVPPGSQGVALGRFVAAPFGAEERLRHFKERQRGPHQAGPGPYERLTGPGEKESGGRASRRADGRGSDGASPSRGERGPANPREGESLGEPMEEARTEPRPPEESHGLGPVRRSTA